MVVVDHHRALLAEQFDAEQVGYIDPEEHIDFQALRPTVVISDGVTREIRWPGTRILAARVPDAARDLVLVLGPEPHLRWREYCDAILEVVSELGCELAVTFGSLLADGIGDTIRVSLTADPVEEVKVAWEILKALGLRERGPVLIACPSCGRSFPELDPRLFSFNSRHGWCGDCYGTGLKIDEVKWDDERANAGTEDHVLDSWIDWLEVDETCPSCNGHRLNREALAVRYQGRSIAELTSKAVGEIGALFRDIKLSGRDAEIARDLVTELNSRLDFLNQVGLGYLALDRSAPTLSGGEAQRIRLAAQLGSNLRGVCYILDEPTIGLHPRDNGLLLDTIEKLAGTISSVSTVDRVRPPITVQPIGARLDESPDSDSAVGTMPATIATVVMTIGCARLNPASMIAARGVTPCFISSSAKSMSRIEFLATIPSSISRPMNTGSDSG